MFGVRREAAMQLGEAQRALSLVPGRKIVDYGVSPRAANEMRDSAFQPIVTTALIRAFTMCRQVLRRGGVITLLLAAAAGSCGQQAPSARADGDPASDVLLVQNVFYPYQPKVRPSLEAALEEALRSSARASGVRFKVAIIGTAAELGLVPGYFGRPQAYARFLDREISFNAPQPLITVMPAGFGVMPAKDAPALAGLRAQAHEGSNGLTRSAIAAVLAVDRYLGHPIPPPSIRPATGHSSSSAPLTFGLPLGLLLILGLVLLVRGRRHSRAAERDDRHA